MNGRGAAAEAAPNQEPPLDRDRHRGVSRPLVDDPSVGHALLFRAVT